MLRGAIVRGLSSAGTLSGRFCQRYVGATGCSAHICASKPTSCSSGSKRTLATDTKKVRSLRAMIEEKTGVTGPWVLGLGLGAWLISKEIYIVGPETVEATVILGTMYILYRKVGGQIGEFLDSQAQEKLDAMNSKREAYVSVLKDAIQDEKSTEEEVGVLRDIFEVHRENNALALETEHRKRLAEVHSEVTKRLNFKVEEESLERRLQQEHIVDWLVNSVQASITPAQEGQMVKQCIADLKKMAIPV
ncbi:ATP synthase F(0) complex subunit B1, mitochondrial-like [Corticium candelabrum]|uniref:ATP synthase F(0) complex subunit B1, mitochondrial-like n=1 Tax=Corticium candelabrum TaxID=121492 RepID=UPI002E26A87B|nr:ATP synthase F(0) complex subunit B1, mitochondrial-like [Corticium candelabrum]